MTTRPLRTFEVLAAALLLLVSACDPGGFGGSYQKSCDLGFMPVKPTVTGISILGNAWAKCDVPPEQHELTISLEQRVKGSGWSKVNSATSAAIPRPRQTYEVKTACQPGTWRVKATVSGSLQGIAFTFTDTSMERFVTAEDCARGQR